jgi:hypothetical protein
MSNELTFTSLTYLLYVLEKQKPQSEPIRRLRCLVFKAISSSQQESSRMFALIDAKIFSGNRIYRTMELRHEIGGCTMQLDDRYIPLAKFPVIKGRCGPKTSEAWKHHIDHASPQWKSMPMSERKRIQDERWHHIKGRKSGAENECKERCRSFLRNENNFKHAIKELQSICPTVHGSANEIVNMSNMTFENNIIRRLISLDGDIFVTFRQMQSFDLGDARPLEIIRDWIRERQEKETVNGMKSIYRCYV